MKNTYMNSDDHAEMEMALDEIRDHVYAAQSRYANFASTHEALGVALEEWNELQDAIKANAIESVREEAIDLAAVLIRLATQCRTSGSLRQRSVVK
jgi:NTP pyrophosphatase (non-canonical NTP hydrolase)